MNRGSLLAMSTALVAVTLAGCPDDIPDECRTTCEDCCERDEACDGIDYDECFSACFRGCQRAYAVYRHSECFDSRILLKACECGLTCEQRDEWEAGTGDYCTNEALQEARDCEWF